MHFIPGLRLRVSEEIEMIGMDDGEMGEFAYDYVGLDASDVPINAVGGLSPRTGSGDSDMGMKELPISSSTQSSPILNRV